MIKFNLNSLQLKSIIIFVISKFLFFRRGKNSLLLPFPKRSLIKTQFRYLIWSHYSFIKQLKTKNVLIWFEFSRLRLQQQIWSKPALRKEITLISILFRKIKARAGVHLENVGLLKDHYKLNKHILRISLSKDNQTRFCQEEEVTALNVSEQSTGMAQGFAVRETSKSTLP